MLGRHVSGDSSVDGPVGRDGFSDGGWRRYGVLLLWELFGGCAIGYGTRAIGGGGAEARPPTAPDGASALIALVRLGCLQARRAVATQRYGCVRARGLLHHGQVEALLTDRPRWP